MTARASCENRALGSIPSVGEGRRVGQRLGCTGQKGQRSGVTGGCLQMRRIWKKGRILLGPEERSVSRTEATEHRTGLVGVEIQGLSCPSMDDSAGGSTVLPCLLPLSRAEELTCGPCPPDQPAVTSREEERAQATEGVPQPGSHPRPTPTCPNALGSLIRVTGAAAQRP